MKILIIEDEQPTALNLQSKIKSIEPLSEFVGIIDTVEDAIAYFQNSTSPDLVFLDIQLADGLCFEIFQEITISCPIIFCTAFDEYAIQAFKVNGMDYILKPFDREAIERSLNKVKNLQNFFQRTESGLEKLTELLNKTHLKGYKSGFLVNQRDKILPIPVIDIAFFYIEHEVTFLYTFENKRYIMNHTLDDLEQKLDPNNFYRANRQFLVNYANIVAVEPYFARKLLVKTKTQLKEPMIVSKAKASDFLNWMECR